MDRLIYYAIQSPDGLYSQGGRTPEWASTPYLWRSKSALLAHLSQFRNFRLKTWNAATGNYAGEKCDVLALTYTDCVVREFHPIPDIVKAIPVGEWKP